MRIVVLKNSASPELLRLIREAKRPRALYQAGAKETQVQISKHLKMLQARGNKKGWPSQKFFAGKSTSVERNVGISEVTDRGAVVTIADPRFVHRIQGGTVTAKRSKMLAIPLTAEAYAKAGKGSIKESMPGLFIIKTARGLFLCQAKNAKGKGAKQKAPTITPLFKLVRSVTHNPHPQDMPDVLQLEKAAAAAMFQAARILFKAQ